MFLESLFKQYLPQSPTQHNEISVSAKIKRGKGGWFSSKYIF